MLMLRAEEGNLEEVLNILNNPRQQPDINAINKRGSTALAVAVKAGAYEVSKVLLSKGADPNIKNNVIFLSIQKSNMENSLAKVLCFCLVGAITRIL